MEKTLAMKIAESRGAQRVVNMAKAYPDKFDAEQLMILQRLSNIVADEVEGS